MEELDIDKMFLEVINSASSEEVDWALKNELELDEKIEALLKISSERKLNIIENLTGNGN